MDNCPNCGTPRNQGQECNRCGVIYAKAEQRAYQKKRQDFGMGVNVDYLKEYYKVDCPACKLVGGMAKKSVPKFSVFLRIIGFLFAIPSVFGAMIFGFLAIASFIGFGAPGAMGFFLFSFLLVASVFFGLVGWILISRKKAWVCDRCGYMMDRA